MRSLLNLQILKNPGRLAADFKLARNRWTSSQGCSRHREMSQRFSPDEAQAYVSAAKCPPHRFWDDISAGEGSADRLRDWVCRAQLYVLEVSRNP